jgi:hypothetical protein
MIGVAAQFFQQITGINLITVSAQFPTIRCTTDLFISITLRSSSRTPSDSAQACPAFSPLRTVQSTSSPPSSPCHSSSVPVVET